LVQKRARLRLMKMDMFHPELLDNRKTLLIADWTTPPNVSTCKMRSEDP